MNQKDASSPFLPLPDGIIIESVDEGTNQVIVQIRSTHPTAVCPLCRQLSERVHGDYTRTVADLPCSGRRVILSLTVRKFVCATPSCPRQIFTERLCELVQSYARMTNRLCEALQALGLATCGELGERLAPKLGMHVSAPTLLRCMRTHAYSEPEHVTIVGIDDWAWRKGTTYGTLVVDLQSRRPIALLPDRSAQTTEAWLRTHPEIALVSRDRGGDYAAAARRGAPQAKQAADKFHLVKNLRDGLKDLMDRHHARLPEVEARGSDAIPVKARGITPSPVEQEEEPITQGKGPKRYRTIPATPYQRPERISYDEYHKQARREKRMARYEMVRALHEQGMSQREIARTLKLSRQTISKFLHAEQYPEMHHKKRGEKPSLLDPYRAYILHRWQQGYRNSVQLYDEITAQGFKGSAPLLRIFLAELRKKHREAGSASALTLDRAQRAITLLPSTPPKPRLTHRMSAGRASWLFIRKEADLSEQQKREVEQIKAAHPELQTAYQLVQAFVLLLSERRSADLDAWLAQASASSTSELKRFAKGLLQDYDAVRTACSTEWSNGQVEAQVNCLKLQKRMVYGRANFDLLRLRVLCRV